MKLEKGLLNYLRGIICSFAILYFQGSSPAPGTEKQL